MKDFYSINWVQDRLICYKHDIKAWIIEAITKRVRKQPDFKLKHRYTIRQAKNLIIKKGFAISGGQPSWFYTAFERQNKDPLTNYALEYIEHNVSREAPILITGGGVGIMAFHLAECGFKDVAVIDLLDDVVDVGNSLKIKFNYDSVIFRQDDCLNPVFNEKQYTVITALHWVFSAFMGNYGNPIINNPYNDEVRENLLDSFFETYASKLTVNGYLFIELTDACSDYRIYTDHPSMNQEASNIYPVRHSPKMVTNSAKKYGLEVIEKKMSVRTGHQPRTLYVIKKNK